MKTRKTQRLIGSFALCFAATSAWPQDATRGAALYRTLPGQPGLGSCISCHGEPINNRNSVLRGATGAAYISRTIGAVGAMGYLRQALSESDLADVAAYLSTVTPAGALDELPAPWPTADHFGSHAIGTAAPEREVLIRNLQPRDSVAIGSVRSSDPLVFPVQHDCPLSLPPLGQCRVRTWFVPSRLGALDAQFQVLDTSGRVLRSGLLTGTGSAVQPAALAWAAGDPRLLDFGRVTIGQSAVRSLRLRNPSAQAVVLQQLRITGPNAARYTLQAACAVAGRLEAGAECELQISHSPTVADRSEAWLEIESDASNAPLVRMTGLGAAAEPTSPPPPPPAVDAGGGGGGGALSVLWLALLALATALLKLSCRCAARRS